MALVGECEVAPSRCGQVIETMVKLLLNATVPEGDLPSTRSALRFADRGHVLSKMHVTETLLGGESWDLHTDGTSKSGKKYVAQQVNVDGQVLTTGFCAVATENTTTLVDVTFNLLQELCDAFEPDDAHQNFLDILQTMSGSMTDRAEVMKSFMRKLDCERKELLQLEDDDTLQFLHCNAHFLLGLSTGCEKVLLQAEKDGGEQLGRDRLPQFRSFQSSTQSSAAR